MTVYGTPRLKQYILEVLKDADGPLSQSEIAAELHWEQKTVNLYLYEFVSEFVREVEPDKWIYFEGTREDIELHFGKPRLKRYILEVLKDADGPLSQSEIAAELHWEQKTVTLYLCEFVSEFVKEVEPGKWSYCEGSGVEEEPNAVSQDGFSATDSPADLVQTNFLSKDLDKPVVAELVDDVAIQEESMPQDFSPTVSFGKTSFGMNYPTLLPAKNIEEFKVHQAALEWSLADPIVINSAADILSSPDWQDRLEPYLHQVQNLMTFCRRLPATIIADDVGLGKTISAGLIAAELIKRRRVDRILIVCPAILCDQWVEELGAKFNIVATAARGSSLDTAIRGNIPVVVTTYNSISNRLGKLPPNAFDMLILDEAHKLRNLHGNKKPPLVATRFKTAMSNRVFKYMLMLTATPIQNKIWDIYSLIDCLTAAKGHVNPLGEPKEFQVNYLRSSNGRELQPEKKEQFRNIMSQYMRRTRRADAKLLFPTRSVELFRVAPTRLDRRIQELVAEHISGLNGLIQSSLGVAMMSSPAAVLKQFRNMSEKDGQWLQVVTEIESLLGSVRELTGKQKGLLQIVEELQKVRGDEFRLVIFTVRRETQRIIGELLTERGIKVGFIRGGQPDANFRAIKRFRADSPEINVIISTDAGAEGVNLQKCNVLVNYDLPWNPMVVEQRIGRIQRLASEHKNVVIQNLIIAGGPEEKIVARLMSKLQAVADTVGDIEGILESTNHSANEDSGASFESEIRKLVLKSLQGVDPGEAVKLSEESIMQAKKMFDEQREEIDRELGVLDQGDDANFTMPQLEKIEPSLSFGQFVRRSMDAGKAKVNSEADGLLRAVWPDRPPERFTFDEQVWRRYSQEGTFHGQVPNLYRPGKPSFERLVQHWLDRSGACIYQSSNSPKVLDDLGQRFVQKIPGAKLENVEITSRPGGFNGTVTLKAKIVNAIDSYEKVVEVQVGERFDHVDVENLELMSSPVGTSEVIGESESEIQKMVAEDKELKAFKEFYEKRLKHEVEKSSSEPESLERIQSDLKPIGYIEPASITGAYVELADLVIDYSFGDKVRYQSKIVVDRSTGEILKSPVFMACEASEAEFPVDVLSECDFTGLRVVKHLLGICPICNRAVLDEKLQNCEITNELVCPDELIKLEVDGRSVLLTLTEKSRISNKVGLKSDMTECEITGSPCFASERKKSDISGKYFRTDQESISKSKRVGHQSEMEMCDFTGVLLCPDEVVVSEVSNKRGNFSDFKYSESGRNVHVSEYVMCAITNRPHPVDECAKSMSGKTAKKSLMIKSEFSGLMYFPGETVKCQMSSEDIPADEAQRCVVTDKIVSPRLTHKCEVTGDFALKKYFVKLVRGGDLALKSEAKICPWLCGYVPRKEIKMCAATNAEFHQSVFSGDSHAVATQVLQRKGQVGSSVLAESIRNATSGKIRRIKGVNFVKSEANKTIMVAVDIANIFGGTSKRAVLLMSNSKTPKIYGKIGVFKVGRKGDVAFKEFIDP
ncbi:DEAD/DEAH box helicase [bacterium]|nr:DEAD/DEAH box helicase [bacterium]